jgi:hypothetical protein
MYTIGLESVFINGSRQVVGIDYNTTNTTVLTLTANALAGDIVQVTTLTGGAVIIGAQGAQGATGNTGAQGAQGAQGVIGAQGATGNTVTMNTYTFSITSNTTLITGADDTANSLIYTPSLESVFINGSRQISGVDYNTTNTTVITLTANALAGDIVQVTTFKDAAVVVGAQGATGNTGAQGAQGVAGDTGAQGITGAQGATGNTGAQGAQGVAGDTGAQGITGAQGAQGVIGPQGAQGDTGSQGATGAQGAQGATGAQGNTGAQGAQGAASSVAGPQGTAGAQGAQGATGAQGAAAVVGGSNTHIQFNDSTSSNGSAGFTFDKTSNNVTVANNISATTGTFAGAVSGVTTLAAGNTTITGFANVTSTLQVGNNIATALANVTAPAYTFIGDLDTGMWSPTADTLAFSTNGAERFRILNTGGITSSDLVDAVGYKGMPQNSQSGDYGLVLADAGKHIFHPVGDNNARTYTIPANANVAFPVGTAITFINMAMANVTIAITTDTLTLSPAGTSGSRTLATNGSATCIKITSTQWLISGSGLT